MNAALRLIAELVPDVVTRPTNRVDSDEDFATPLLLEDLNRGWKDSEVYLAADASDTALTFTSAIAIILIADGPFRLRVAAAETLLANLRAYVVWCDDTADAAKTTSVLLSGNGTTPVTVRAIVLEKPAA